VRGRIDQIELRARSARQTGSSAYASNTGSQVEASKPRSRASSASMSAARVGNVLLAFGLLRRRARPTNRGC
jgi:hypothetical protein